MLSALLKLIVGGALALALLVPVGIVLAIVGVPALLLLAILAIPVVAVLAVVGLPVLLTVLAAGVIFAVIVGLLGMLVGLTVAAVKVALCVILPVAIVVWLVRRIADAGRPSYDWA
jgi:hypothetical protein